jgi:hypothetical protein
MIQVDELFRQLIEMVELLAASASEQKKWLRAEGYPPDELGLQFIDAVPGWFGRLEGASLLSRPAKDRLMELKNLLGALLVPSHQSMWVASGVTDQSSDWHRIRDLARLALVELNRPGPVDH